MQLSGIYIGIVEKVNDPERLGRVKVRVPSVFGVLGGGGGAVPVDDLPWCIPMGLPAGATFKSGGCDWLPLPGDQVAVQFLDGEPEKPIWSWLMQAIDDSKRFKLHAYTDEQGQVGNPKRGAWTRYGHAVEWTDGSLVMTTSGGYRVFLLDGLGDGRATLSTQLGQFLEFDDSTLSATLNVLEDCYLVVGAELNTLAGSLRTEAVADSHLVVGANLDVEVGAGYRLDVLGDTNVTAGGLLDLSAGESLRLTAGASMQLDFAIAHLGLGAAEPFVLGNQLTTFLRTLLLWLATHTHGNGNFGSPTTPPLAPPESIVKPDIALLVSRSIYGQP